MPEQLDFVRKVRISIEAHALQRTSLLGVKPARWHVDVLSFNLQLYTVTSPGPVLCGSKQHCSNALPPHLGNNADVPQHRKIRSAFEQVDIRRSEGDDGSSNELRRRSHLKKSPIAHVKATRPLKWTFSIKPVVVFHVRHINRPFRKDESFTASTGAHVINAFDRERDRNLTELGNVVDWGFAQFQVHLVASARRAPAFPHKPKQRMLGPAATTTYCWAPTLKVMGEAFMRTLVGNCHNVRPSR